MRRPGARVIQGATCSGSGVDSRGGASKRSAVTRGRSPGESCMSRLAGKVALVSGAGRGIGRSIAMKLAAEGARVVINDLDRDPAEETVATIVEDGGEAVACVGSVTATDFPERFVRTAVDTYQ